MIPPCFQPLDPSRHHCHHSMGTYEYVTPNAGWRIRKREMHSLFASPLMVCPTHRVEVLVHNQWPANEQVLIFDLQKSHWRADDNQRISATFPGGYVEEYSKSHWWCATLLHTLSTTFCSSCQINCSGKEDKVTAWVMEGDTLVVLDKLCRARYSGFLRYLGHIEDH